MKTLKPNLEINFFLTISKEKQNPPYIIRSPTSIVITMDTFQTIYLFPVPVFPCDFKVSPEHAGQMAITQNSGIDLDECLALSENADEEITPVVFCHADQFCGLTLQPTLTAGLKILYSDKNCSVFAKTLDQCAEFKGQLFEAGKNIQVFIIKLTRYKKGKMNIEKKD